MKEEAGLPLAGLPEGLLLPILELTGEVLRALPPDGVPAGARRLAAFDRRGLATPTARAQLRRLLETDEQLSSAVADAFAQSPEAVAALEGWTAEAAAARVAAMEAAGELPVLASALVAARPAGWEFGLGVAVAAFQAERSTQAAAGRLRERERQVAALEEAVRRAEAARKSAEAQADRLAVELREARRARRADEERVISGLAEAGHRVEELEAELAEAIRRRGEAEAQARGEARRAAAESRARRAAEQAATAAREEVPAPPPGPDPADVAAAAGLTGRLAETIAAAAGLVEELGGVLSPERSGAEPPGGTRPGTLGRWKRRHRPRRAAVSVPPGMLADTPEAAEAMVRTPDLALVVDGYNVSMLAWPDSSPADQRQRLLGALSEFGLRARVGITVVFDGADVGAVRPNRRPGLRVVFSAAGQEADEVVVGEVAARPLEVQVLVVSSDAWVRAESEAHGAQVIGSDLFLSLLRR